jgi:hypothetical protein
LGDGTYDDAYYPIQILGLSDIISIDDGGNFAMFLKNDGTVWITGDNNFGQLGIGSNIASSDTVVQVTALSDIVAIEAGSFQCFAIKNDDTVWAWGWNNNNQLGNIDGIEINAPVQVMGICSDIINVEDENESTSSDFTIYPNPTSDQLFIRFNDSDAKNITRMSISDLTGKSVWQSSQIVQNMPIDVSMLPQGVYSISLQGKKTNATEQFVITR